MCDVDDNRLDPGPHSAWHPLSRGEFIALDSRTISPVQAPPYSDCVWRAMQVDVPSFFCCARSRPCTDQTSTVQYTKLLRSVSPYYCCVKTFVYLDRTIPTSGWPRWVLVVSGLSSSHGLRKRHLTVATPIAALFSPVGPEGPSQQPLETSCDPLGPSLRPVPTRGATFLRQAPLPPWLACERALRSATARRRFGLRLAVRSALGTSTVHPAQDAQVTRIA